MKDLYDSQRAIIEKRSGKRQNEIRKQVVTQSAQDFGKLPKSLQEGYNKESTEHKEIARETLEAEKYRIRTEIVEKKQQLEEANKERSQRQRVSSCRWNKNQLSAILSTYNSDDERYAPANVDKRRKKACEPPERNEQREDKIKDYKPRAKRPKLPERTLQWMRKICHNRDEFIFTALVVHNDDDDG